MSKLALADLEQLAAALEKIDFDPVELVSGTETVAVVLGVTQLSALYATQELLATTGALSAIDEGLADLAAGRTEDWRQLRTEYGRGGAEPGAEGETGATAGPESGAGEAVALEPSGLAVLASHRARWDLDLLPPQVAAPCLDLLDGWTRGADAPGQPLTAGFPDLSLSCGDGFRLVHRISPFGVLEVVHISGG